MPARSKRMTWVSADAPGTTMQLVLGSRAVAAPTIRRRRHHRQDLALQLVTQPGQPGSVLQCFAGGLGGGAKAGDAGDVLGSRPPPPFLPAAAQQRRQPQGRRGDDRTDTLGSAELVRRNGDGIDAEFGERDWHLAGRLHGIGEYHGTSCLRPHRERWNRLDDTGFVVGELQGDENFAAAGRHVECAVQLARLDHSVGIDGEFDDAATGGAGRLTNTVMFDAGKDDGIEAGARRLY